MRIALESMSWKWLCATSVPQPERCRPGAYVRFQRSTQEMSLSLTTTPLAVSVFLSPPEIRSAPSPNPRSTLPRTEALRAFSSTTPSPPKSRTTLPVKWKSPQFLAMTAAERPRSITSPATAKCRTPLSEKNGLSKNDSAKRRASFGGQR